MSANIKVKSDSQQFKEDMKKMADSIKLTSSEFQVAQTKANLFGDAQEQLEANINSLNSKLSGQNTILGMQKDGFNKIASEIDKYKNRNIELSSAIDKKSNAIKEELKLNGENTQEYKKLTNELNKLQKEYNQNNSAMSKNESSLNALKLKMNQTQIEILQTQKSLDKLGNEFESSGKKSKDLSKNVEDLKEKFSGIEGAAIKGGAAIAGAMVAGVGALAVGANNTVESLNDLKAKTGATTEQMNDFGEVAKNLYNNGMGDSFKSVTDAMAIVNQTLWLTGDELEVTTQNAIMLGDTFDADINDTVKTTNSLMTNFGLNSEEAMTLIAQGFQQGGNASGDLLDSMNEYSVQFSTMGFSAEDFTNILINGAKSGAFSIDKVGDAVKEFNIRSKDGSKTTIEAYQQLGLNADELSNKFAKGGASGQEAFKQVMDAIKTIDDPVKQNQIGVSLYGTMWEDLGADAVKALTDIGDNANRSADTLKSINDVKYGDVGSAISGIGRTLKTELTDTITTNVLPKLNEFATKIKENMPEIQAKVEGAINIVVPLFEGFVAVLGFAIDNSNWLIPVLAGVTGSIIALNAISFVIGLMATWATVTEGLTVIQGVFNVVLSANPIGLVIIAIGALIAIGVALWMNWDTIKIKCGEFIDGIVQKWKVFQIITGTVFQAVGDSIMKPINWAKDKVGEAIEGIKKFFKFEWSFPHLKMPRFTFTGSVNPLKWGDLGVPKVGVEWYAKGGIMTAPTMFGMNGNNAMVGGEAGAEAILPLSQLWKHLGDNFNKLEERLNNNNQKQLMKYIELLEKNNKKDVLQEGQIFIVKNYMDSEEISEVTYKNTNGKFALATKGRR